MLTPYDEFPVHQAPYPFSYIPSTDYAWDDGYWFAVFNADEKLFLGCYLRVNPNTDMIGGCVVLNVAGYQLTVRFNRCWRRHFALEVGPFKVTIEEPLRRIRLTMADHGSGLTFDIVWEGASPAFLEGHHIATSRGRRTTDQSRYSQPGTGSGWIRFRERQWQLTPDRWSGARDHSWGLYASRPPLSPPASLLPSPANDDGPKRALRFWNCFRTEPFSGFYHFHETAQGVQCEMNDVFGTPFGGRLYRGWDDEAIELVSGRHEMIFNSGTRILKQAKVFLHDAQGREWRQTFDIETPPWLVQPMGAFPGSWKDGGTFFTYHGSEELALEWDEADYSQQPVAYQPYAVSGANAEEGFNTGTAIGNLVHGPEYLARVTTYAPDGTISTGAAQVELFINGAYEPYGFE